MMFHGKEGICTEGRSAGKAALNWLSFETFHMLDCHSMSYRDN